MPIYEYQCTKCGERFEELRPHSSADAEIICINCHSKSTKRVLSSFNAKSSSGSIPGSQSGCSGCTGGNCSSCH